MSVDEILEALHRNQPSDAGYDDVLRAEAQAAPHRIGGVPRDLERTDVGSVGNTLEHPRRSEPRGTLEEVVARCGHGGGACERPPRRPPDRTRAFGHRDIGSVQADDERNPMRGSGERPDRPVRDDPVHVHDVEPAGREQRPRGARRGREDDGCQRVERLADLHPSLKRLRESPWRPRTPRGVSIVVVVHGALARGPRPLTMLRKEHVHRVPLCRDAPNDGLDERGRRVPLVPGVRRGDCENLHRPALSAGRPRPCAPCVRAPRSAPRAVT